jgi:hypothetical protein
MRLPGSGAAIRNVTRPMRVREVLREYVNLGDAASRVIRQVSTRWPGLFAALLDNAQRAAAVSAAVRPESGQPARTTMPSWSPADCQAAVDASPPQHAADHAPGRSSSGTPGLAAYGVGRWDGITRFADPACIATRLIEHPASPDQHPSLTAAQSPRLVPFRELLDYFEDLALVAGAKPRGVLLVPAACRGRSLSRVTRSVIAPATRRQARLMVIFHGERLPGDRRTGR